ncbi:MAG: ester cyclase [Caldilineaceae bacterium]|nr:ester cyclase [Caldilineaceae bacterium]
MKTFFQKAILALMLVWGMIVIPHSVALAQDSNPETIYRAAYDAFNNRDMESGMALIADDIVGVLLPPPPGVEPVQMGKESFQQLLEDVIATNMTWELSDFQINGNSASYNVSLKADDILADYDVYPLEFEGYVVVQDGLIVNEVWNMTAQSRADIARAQRQLQNKAIVMRAYEEVLNQGNFDVLEQDIAPNAVDHSFPDLQGIDAFKGPMMGLREAFPDLQASVDMIITEGDLVTALVTFTGTHQGEFLGVPPSGQQITWSHVDINRIENGQVVEAWHIGTPAAILEAMGYQLTPPAE